MNIEAVTQTSGAEFTSSHRSLNEQELSEFLKTHLGTDNYLLVNFTNDIATVKLDETGPSGELWEKHRVTRISTPLKAA